MQFTDEEIALINEDVSDTIKGMDLMRDLRQSLGDMWPERGVVRPNEYEEVKKLLSQAKRELVDRIALSPAERTEWESSWPFDE